MFKPFLDHEGPIRATQLLGRLLLRDSGYAHKGVADKVVIDTNNYYPQRDGHFEELDSDRTTSSGLLQAHLAGARVVKAFSAILDAPARRRSAHRGSRATRHPHLGR